MATCVPPFLCRTTTIPVPRPSNLVRNPSRSNLLGPYADVDDLNVFQPGKGSTEMSSLVFGVETLPWNGVNRNGWKRDNFSITTSATAKAATEVSESPHLRETVRYIPDKNYKNSLGPGIYIE